MSGFSVVASRIKCRDYSDRQHSSQLALSGSGSSSNGGGASSAHIVPHSPAMIGNAAISNPMQAMMAMMSCMSNLAQQQQQSHQQQPMGGIALTMLNRGKGDVVERGGAGKGAGAAEAGGTMDGDHDGDADEGTRCDAEDEEDNEDEEDGQPPAVKMRPVARQGSSTFTDMLNAEFGGSRGTIPLAGHKGGRGGKGRGGRGKTAATGADGDAAATGDTGGKAKAKAKGRATGKAKGKAKAAVAKPKAAAGKATTKLILGCSKCRRSPKVRGAETDQYGRFDTHNAPN